MARGARAVLRGASRAPLPALAQDAPKPVVVAPALKKDAPATYPKQALDDDVSETVTVDARLDDRRDGRT